MVCLELMDIVWVTFHLVSLYIGEETALAYLLVDNNVYFDALLGLPLKETIQAPLWEVGSRPSQIKFRGKPPVLEAVERLQVQTGA